MTPGLADARIRRAFRPSSPASLAQGREQATGPERQYTMTTLQAQTATFSPQAAANAMFSGQQAGAPATTTDVALAGTLENHAIILEAITNIEAKLFGDSPDSDAGKMATPEAIQWKANMAHVQSVQIAAKLAAIIGRL